MKNKKPVKKVIKITLTPKTKSKPKTKKIKVSRRDLA